MPCDRQFKIVNQKYEMLEFLMCSRVAQHFYENKTKNRKKGQTKITTNIQENWGKKRKKIR